MVSVHDPASFTYRVDYAARCILRGRVHTRGFDDCFEMYDGDAVVAALAHRMRNHPDLDRAVRRYWPASAVAEWHHLADRYAGQPLSEVARQLHQAGVIRSGIPCPCAWCDPAHARPDPHPGDWIRFHHPIPMTDGTVHTTFQLMRHRRRTRFRALTGDWYHIIRWKARSYTILPDRPPAPRA